MNKHKIVQFLMITLGVIIVNIGFYFFLQEFNLIIGGMMGLSLLLDPFLPFNVGIIYLVLNTIALFIGLIFLGKDFFVKTIYATLIGPLIVSLLELLHIPTNLILQHLDEGYKLMFGAIGGGILVGGGLGLVLRTGATTGGMDVYQKIIHKYLKVPFSVAMYLTDGIIVLLAMFISLQNGLFSIVAMVLTAMMIEKTAIIGKSSFAILIITDLGDQIKTRIYADIDRGLTRVNVKGGYSNKDKELIITTVTRQELFLLKDLVKEVDPEAFTLILKTKEVLGLGFHRDDIS